MRGAMYLFPICGIDGQTRTEENVEAVHEISRNDFAALDETSQVNTMEFIAHIKNIKRDLIPYDNVPSSTNQLLQHEVPEWMQTVIKSNCFEHDSSRQNNIHGHKNVSGVKRRRSDISTDFNQYQNNKQISVAKHEENESKLDGDMKSHCVDGNPGTKINHLITQDLLVGDSLEKYSEVLQQILSNFNNQEEDKQHLATNSISSTLLATLSQVLKVMKKKDVIAKIDPNLLITLIDSLTKQIQRQVLQASLQSQGNEHHDSHFQGDVSTEILELKRLQLCMECEICVLIIMSASSSDRRILSEEAIDTTVEFSHYIVTQILQPYFDPIIRVKSKASSQGLLSNSTLNKTPFQNLKLIKKSKFLRQALENFVSLTCEFFEYMSTILLSVKIADQWILRISTCTMKVFMLHQNSLVTMLQQSALLVMRAIFVGYKDHRSLLLEDILSVLIKLPSQKRSLTTLALSQPSESSVQVISMLIVSLIQSCLSIDNALSNLESSTNRIAPTNANIEEALRLEENVLEARDCAGTFIRSLLKECMQKKDDIDTRQVLENLLDDFLKMHVHPEWIATEILLQGLCSSLIFILNDSVKLESLPCVTALHMLGKICTSIKQHMREASKDLSDSDEAGEVIQNHETVLMTELKETHVSKKPKSAHAAIKRAVVVYLNNLQTACGETNVSFCQDALSGFLMVSMMDENSSPNENALWRSYLIHSSLHRPFVMKGSVPTQDLCIQFALQLALKRDFCQLFDKLLAHMMKLLVRGVATFRARVVKTLSWIVDVDPLIMSNDMVHNAISHCCTDESISVRQAAVDLVGKYILLKPQLFDTYYEMLAERLKDKGISVRKSVCKLFRSILHLPAPTHTLSSESHYFSEMKNTSKMLEEQDYLRQRSACMRSLVERIGSTTEESQIKNYIISTFQEVWFGEISIDRNTQCDELFDDDKTSISEPPPGWKFCKNDTAIQALSGNNNNDHNDSVGGKLLVSPDGRVASTTEEAWKLHLQRSVTPSSLVKVKRMRSDPTPHIVCSILAVIYDMPDREWFIALLERLLKNDTDRDTKNNCNNIKDRSHNVNCVIEKSTKIISCLVDSLLHLEEGKMLKNIPIRDESSQFLAVVSALAAFGEVNPGLLEPHLEMFLIYLKSDTARFTPSIEVQIQSIAVGIIYHILQLKAIEHRRTPVRIISRIANDLQNLIMKSQPSVVSPSIDCLAILSSQYRSLPMSSMLVKILETFYTCLDKYQGCHELPASVSSSVQRALFVCSRIALVIPMDGCIKHSKLLEKGEITDLLYDICTQYIWKIPATCATKAVQALGFLFRKNPHIFLKAHQQELLGTLLSTIDQPLCLQALISIKELLRTEERKSIKDTNVAQNRTKDVKLFEQEKCVSDNALLGGVMQAQLESILRLSTIADAVIRHEAVGCIIEMVTQGLVTPVLCVPTLVALETDTNALVREKVHLELKELNQKFPGIVNTPSIEGIALSFDFQMRCFYTNSSVPKLIDIDKQKNAYCVFGPIYTECIRHSRRHRHIFFQSLVNQFTDKGAVFAENVKGQHASLLREKVVHNWTTKLIYLAYLAQLLSALPYEEEDEPLYIIYLINRYSSLKLGYILEELKSVFAELGIPPELSNQSDETDISAISLNQISKKSIDAFNAKTDINAQLGKMCDIAHSMHMLLQVKFFLKSKYLLDDEACQTYQPSNSSKFADAPLTISADHMVIIDMKKLNIEAVIENRSTKITRQSKTHEFEKRWIQFTSVCRTAHEDQSHLDIDISYETSQAKKVRRRKSVVRASK